MVERGAAVKADTGLVLLCPRFSMAPVTGDHLVGGATA